MTKEFWNHRFEKDDVTKTNSLPPDIFRQHILSEGQSSTDTNTSSDADSGFQRSETVKQFFGVKSETQSFSDSDDFVLAERSQNICSSDEGMFRSTEEALSSIGRSSIGDCSDLKTKWLKSVDAATLSIIKVILLIQNLLIIM